MRYKVVKFSGQELLQLFIEEGKSAVPSSYYC